MDFDLEMIKCNWPYITLVTVGFVGLAWFTAHYVIS
jgi:hypothetical protein